MSEENKKMLGEQLVRCLLDDKLPLDKKLKKMDYLIRLGGDINARYGTGYSALSLAKFMKNDDLVNFLEERGAKEIGFDKEKAKEFFWTASVEEINKVLSVLPDGYELDCDVDLSERCLTELPDFSKFIVNGDFSCALNNLETLKGAPREVGGNFYCDDNLLTCLRGAPRKVSGDFCCQRNQLTNLEGAPREVGGKFRCDRNPLKSYEGKPEQIGGGFKAPDILSEGKRNAGIDR